MSSYPSAASTPYRVPLIPPSQCSYISDFNQSLASPNSRRIYATQKRQPIGTDCSNSVNVVIDKANSNKIKYSMAILVILSLSSLLFTSFGLYILSIYLSFPLIYESDSSVTVDNDASVACKIQYARVTLEVVVVSAVVSTISSLTTFFVTAVQLIVILRFALYLLILSCQVEFVSQLTGAAFGVFCLLICAVSCLHTAHSLWRRRFWTINDEKDGQKSDLSTLDFTSNKNSWPADPNLNVR
uniref:G_PROTEIN_RECEP_F1_2 domain-containing protein n=1 Tax=Syphacia muris TaxID=451379 RepID=A0A0N5AUL3_9BILA